MKKNSKSSKEASKALVPASKSAGGLVLIDGQTSDRRKFATPKLQQRSAEIQPYGSRIQLPLGLTDKACKASIEALNTVLADTMTLRDLYKKHHWQVAGSTFYQLHLLYDKHYNEQSELVDLVAERIQTLGGISLAMARDVAEETNIECPPRGREEVPVQISRLVEAHEIILIEARKFAKSAQEAGDDGTNDLLISNIVRTNELQTWFIAEHMAPESLIQAIK